MGAVFNIERFHRLIKGETGEFSVNCADRDLPIEHGVHEALFAKVAYVPAYIEQLADGADDGVR